MYAYQQMYQQPMQFQQPQQQTMPQMQNGNQNMQIQNGGFVTVRSEEEAQRYPVAPGSSITFFNETQPYCYKKTMSFSPLDHPVFEKYKIVKEEVEAEQAPAKPERPWEMDIDDLRTKIEILEKELVALKSKPRPVAKKKEDAKDDSE